MAFPTSALPALVEIAPGADPSADSGTWSWVDITSSTRLRDGIQITHGRADESARVAPSVCRLRLDNRAGDFTPRNPNGQYYGSLGRNTPIRVRLQWAKDAFGRTTSSGWGTSDSGQVWTTSGGAASDYSTTGTRGRHTHTATGSLHHSLIDAGRSNVDVLADVTIAVGTASTAPVTAWVAARASDTNNYYAVRIELGNPSGGATMTLSLWKRAGGALSGPLDAKRVTVGTHIAGATWRIRFRVTGSTLQAKAWLPASTEPSAWQIESTDAALTTGTLVGLFSRFETGNTNTLPQNIDWDNVTVTNDRFSGFVSSWPLRWDKSGNDATVPIEANGVLRRLGQGNPPALSAMRRTLVASGPVGYWPVEDGEAAGWAASALPGHPPLTVDGTVEFKPQSDYERSSPQVVYGTESLADLSGGASLSTTAPADVTAGTATEFTVYVTTDIDIATVSGDLVLVDVSTTSGERWLLRMTTGLNTQVVRVSSSGAETIVINSGGVSSSFIGQNFSVWQNGANIEVGLNWVASLGVWTATGSTAGTMAGITGVTVNATKVTQTSPLPMGHLTVWATHPVPLDVRSAELSYSFASAAETAHERLSRLCTEDDVLYSSSAASSESVGAQPVGTLLDLLEECAAADQGVLYESGFGLGFLSREERYNRDVALALDFDSGQIADPPEPTDDDQQIRNRVIVRRSAGSAAVAENTDSIAKHGRYEDEVTVNHGDDTALADHAAWRVHLGTTDAMRWPRIDLNLARATDLIDDWLACGIGSRVTADNPPDQVAGDDIDVIVEGYTETLGYKDWDVALNCSPAQPWTVGVLDSASLAKLDTAGSQLAAQFISGTNTSMSVSTTTGPLWTTEAAQFPFDIECGGVRLTVTNITGASSPQTFTITQTPVNGVVKTIPAGTAVSLWQPLVLAL